MKYSQRGSAMKVIESSEGENEAKVLAAMVSDSVVLARIALKWEDGLFSSPHCNLIASWCIKYHQTYSSAPGKGISLIFESWQDSNQDAETTKLVEHLLSSTSDRWEGMQEISSEHLVDLAAQHFFRVAARKLSESIIGDLDSGKLDKIRERVNTFQPIELGAGSSVDLISDEEQVRSTFDYEVHETLIDYPGDLGKFLGRSMRRGGFIGFEGPEKSGKSFFLLDAAIRALQQRNRVAYFQVGDLTLTEIKERIVVRLSKHPLYAGQVKWPVSITPGENQANVEMQDREYDVGLTADKAWLSCQKFMRKVVKSKRCFFKLSCHSNMSIDVQGIRNILVSWERAGWSADVVVIDYADVLAPPKGIKESRDQINDNWARMRSLSQEHHCLLITATQVRRDGYGKSYLTRMDTADDKRKLSHVTGMIGINCSDPEKEKGSCRLNWVLRREEEFTSSRQVHVAQCLSLAQPAVLSLTGWKRKSKQGEEE